MGKILDALGNPADGKKADSFEKREAPKVPMTAVEVAAGFAHQASAFPDFTPELQRIEGQLLEMEGGIGSLEAEDVLKVLTMRAFTNFQSASRHAIKEYVRVDEEQTAARTAVTTESPNLRVVE